MHDREAPAPHIDAMTEVSSRSLSEASSATRQESRSRRLRGHTYGTSHASGPSSTRPDETHPTQVEDEKEETPPRWRHRRRWRAPTS